MGLIARQTAILLGGASLFMALGVHHAATQDGASDGVTVLERIQVTAKKEAAGAVSDSPTATQTTAEDLRERQITNIQDLGNTTEPGVNYSAATKSINIRGLEDDRVLTTIDGVRIPFMPDYARSGYGGVNAFDFTSLATVDIVRGADSSRGGSGMLGGAVVLRTLEPEDLINGDKNWGAFLQSTYDSRDSSILGSAAYAQRFGNTSFLMQGSYRKGSETESNGDVGGLGVTRSEANPLDYDQTNLLFKLRHDLEGGHRIGISAERFAYDSDADLMTTQGTDYVIGSNTGIDNTRRERISLDYRYDSPGDGWLDAVDASLYWQRLVRFDGNRGDRLRAPAGYYHQFSDNRNTSIGLVGTAEKRFTTGNMTHDLAMGVDISGTMTTQFVDGESSCVPPFAPGDICNFYHLNQADMPDVDGKRIGLFVDDKITFGDSGFSLTPGMRFDWFDYKPKPSDAWDNNSGSTTLPPARDGSRLSPKLRASYEISPTAEIYAQWAMGFKAPNVGQLYYRYAKSAGIPTYETIGNENLKPEISNGIEVGMNFGDQRFGGHIGAFHNRYKDFIETVRLATPNPGYMSSYQMMNLERVQISGVEARLHKQFDNGFHVRGALSYASGKNLDTGKGLASVAPLKVVAGLGYSAETWGAEVSAIAVAAVSDTSAAVFKAPGYGIVNLAAWWAPEKVEGLRIQGSVHNLFDKTYFDALAHRDINMSAASSLPMAYYSEPGRNFKLSITKQF